MVFKVYVQKRLCYPESEKGKDVTQNVLTGLLVNRTIQCQVKIKQSSADSWQLLPHRCCIVEITRRPDF